LTEGQTFAILEAEMIHDWSWSGGTMAFTVSDFHDLIRLLEANPEWRAQLLRTLAHEKQVVIVQDGSVAEVSWEAALTIA
jgi:hypothetical protein